MSRRRIVQYALDAGNVKSIPEDEIKIILRAADELISIGGRNLLAKILKGSKEKKVLEHGLDKCPVYGYYHSLTLEAISYRVDWMIKQDYLRIEYFGQLPMIVFSEKGWEIEKETFTEELYQKFCLDMKGNDFRVIHEMKSVNRQVVYHVLEKIRASRDEGFIPILEEWKKLEVQKVRARINSVETTLRDKDSGPFIERRKTKKGDVQRVMVLVQEAIGEKYSQYYPENVLQMFGVLHSAQQIGLDIEKGNVWMLFADGNLAGIGSLEENSITRVYVTPKMQGKGLGTRIMYELEKIIKQKFEYAQLYAFLPAYSFFEKLGYHTVKHEQIAFGGEDIAYQVMQKKFTDD